MLSRIIVGGMLVTSEPHLRPFWYPVAFVEDLERGPLARTLLGEDLVIWSPANGDVAAAYDRCPHRSARLSAGSVEEGCLICPYHGWQYGGDGKAVVIPQLEPGVPIPPRAQLTSVSAAERYGVVWVALEPPVRPVPDVPAADELGVRTIRQFDEVWDCAAARLMDNSFDPAHVAFVHQGSFGNPKTPRVLTPDVERTSDGLVMRTVVEVENPKSTHHVTGTDDARTTRDITTTYHAPFLRVLDQTYPSGIRHTIVMGATPIDDSSMRLVQWCIRNDSDDDVPRADVVAFDRQVTLEDRALLEATWPDYELDLTANVHLKVDRATIELRRVLGEICAGEWSGVSASEA